MAVACADAMAVVHDDRASIATHEIGEHDHAVGGGDDGLAIAGPDVNATMEGAFSVEGIDALAKRSRNGTLNRPKVGGGICPEPVGGGGIAGETQRDSGHSSSGQSRSFERPELIE